MTTNHTRREKMKENFRVLHLEHGFFSTSTMTFTLPVYEEDLEHLSEGDEVVLDDFELGKITVRVEKIDRATGNVTFSRNATTSNQYSYYGPETEMPFYLPSSDVRRGNFFTSLLLEESEELVREEKCCQAHHHDLTVRREPAIEEEWLDGESQLRKERRLKEAADKKEQLRREQQLIELKKFAEPLESPTGWFPELATVVLTIAVIALIAFMVVTH